MRKLAKFIKLKVAVSVTILLGLLGSAHAQSKYPERPVRIIVPFPAGGAADTFGRVAGERLQAKLGQVFYVENRTGAGSMIGSDIAAKSDPDGYTLLLGSTANTTMFAVNTHVTYDLNRDLQPICRLVSLPNVLVVNPQSPYKTVADIVKAAQANPGKLTFGSSGLGTGSHLTGEMFRSEAKIDIVHVPYKGNPPAQLDLMADRISMEFDNAAQNLISAGKLRAVAVPTAERWPTLPDVPTFTESGYPGFDVFAWYGVWVRKGTPTSIVDLLRKTLKESYAEEGVKAKLAPFGAKIDVLCGDDFQTFINSELFRWKKIATEANVKIDN